MSTRKPVGPEGHVVYHLNIQVKQGIYRIHEKIGIFEIGEHEQVHEDAHDHSEFLPSFPSGMMDQVPQVDNPKKLKRPGLGRKVPMFSSKKRGWLQTGMHSGPPSACRGPNR